MSQNDPKRTSLVLASLSSLREENSTAAKPTQRTGEATTFTGIMTFPRAQLVMPLLKPHMSLTGTPDPRP
jgi:hypothetical protein